MPMRLRSPLPGFEGATEWINREAVPDTLEGRPVLVHFWAASCKVCERSLPRVNEWRDKYGQTHNLQVIGVHTPRSEKDTDKARVLELAELYKLTHPVILDNGHAVTDAFQNECVPAYYLFDGAQQLRHFQAGDKGMKMVEQRLHKILGVKPDQEA